MSGSENEDKRSGSDIRSSGSRRRGSRVGRRSSGISEDDGMKMSGGSDHEEGDVEGGDREKDPLEARHDSLNHMFGIRPWRPHVTHIPMERHSSRVQSLYRAPNESSFEVETTDTMQNVGNIIWAILFGAPLAASYKIVAVILYISIVGRPYAPVAWDLGSYYFWPFGKYLVSRRTAAQYHASAFVDITDSTAALTESDRLLDPSPEELDAQNNEKTTGYYVWVIIASVPLTIIHAFVFAICWMIVVMIPMAKVNQEAIRLLFQDPIRQKLHVASSGVGSNIVLCTFQAVNIYYYKYSVGGMNICLVNLIPFVVFALALGYLGPLVGIHTNELLMCGICLLSIVPLSYYIGTAVSSLSAQSNFAVGAVLNASFGSIVELLLYFAAIQHGGLQELVQASITGSLLVALLMMPGLSMIFGGVKHKEQRFSPSVAGVSSVMLFISIVGAFTPTIFHSIYGHQTLSCSGCMPDPHNINGTLGCTQCTMVNVADLDEDEVYNSRTRPLMYICAVILPLAYAVGLIFTLKTHTHIYEPAEGEEAHGGHDAPEWSKKKGLAILITATALFALIAEELVNSIKPALADLGVTQSFIGITVVAVVTAAAEIVNAIGFAMQDNIALSIEIGSSVAIQISLIQMPVLVAFSAALNSLSSENSFILVFPLLQTFAAILAAIIVNYVSAEGVANYFKGAALLTIHVLFICAFFFVPKLATTESSGETHH